MKEIKFSKDWEPVECHCGSKDFNDELCTIIEGQVLEVFRTCQKCKSPLGWWAYGKWESPAEQKKLFQHQKDIK